MTGINTLMIFSYQNFSADFEIVMEHKIVLMIKNRENSRWQFVAAKQTGLLKTFECIS